MRVILRIVLVPVSLFIALLLAIFAARRFVYHVRPGFNEGTPVTILVFAAVFLFVLVGILVVGNVLVSRHFKGENSK